MFEEPGNHHPDPETPNEAGTEAPTTDLARLHTMRTAVLELDLDLDARALLELMAKLEELKSSIAAAQAMTATLFEAQVISRHRTLKVHRTNHAYGAGAQIALARRESQDLGPRYLAYAKTLITDLPHTLGALTRGEISEPHAMAIARETAHLTPEDRQGLDAELMDHPHALEGVGTRELASRLKALAYRHDSRDALNTLAHTRQRRYLSIFPTREGTIAIHGILPLDTGLALQQALNQAAQQLKNTGDTRTLDQLRCDLAAERITGTTPARGTKILLNLVMTDRTLFQGDPEPAQLAGYGTVPASWARELIAGGHHDPRFSRATTSLIRLYTAPGTGQLLAMDSRQRRFPPALKHLITIRDQTCRTPYCNAPIKHLDHILQHALGGPTSEANGAGRCARCNQTKQAHGWRENTIPGPRHTLEIHTPTAHTYRSTAPPLPGTPPPQ